MIFFFFFFLHLFQFSSRSIFQVYFNKDHPFTSPFHLVFINSFQHFILPSLFSVTQFIKGWCLPYLLGRRYDNIFFFQNDSKGWSNDLDPLPGELGGVLHHENWYGGGNQPLGKTRIKPISAPFFPVFVEMSWSSIIQSILLCVNVQNRILPKINTLFMSPMNKVASNYTTKTLNAILIWHNLCRVL